MKIRSTFLVAFLLFFVFVSAQKTKQSSEPKFPEAGTYSHSKLSHKLISGVNTTYGYDIYSDGKLIIHQPTVPGMPGTEGFRTKNDAEKIAQLVTTKIKNGEMPPTVSPEEMRKLKVLP